MVNIENKLNQYGQLHLLNFYDELNENEKTKLLNQIDNISFEEIAELNGLIGKEKDFSKDIIEPIKYINKQKLSEIELNTLSQKGEQIIKNKKIAVVTLAGGQGTRLGCDNPKGMYKIGLDTEKCIFEILCDELKRVRNKYGVSIDWYLMTSKENDKITKDFFESNNYFDYGKENIGFFIQGELPVIDAQGKILLEEKYKIKVAGDGHGGVFKAMYKNGVLDKMKKDEIQWVSIAGVDNILAKPIDPLLIGITVDSNNLAGGKSSAKAYAEEKVGVFCKKNGKVGIIEYSEISTDLASRKDDNGEFVFGESNIMCNLFNIKVLESVVNDKLPYHVAHKKVGYINKAGEKVKPEIENAYKFEMFMFDVFEKMDEISLLRVKREEEFAPVKSKEGKDSPETAKKLYMEYFGSKEV